MSFKDTIKGTAKFDVPMIVSPSLGKSVKMGIYDNRDNLVNSEHDDNTLNADNVKKYLQWISLDTNDISKEFKELNNNIEKIGIKNKIKIDNYEERILKLENQTETLLERNKILKEKNRTLEKRQQENFNENVNLYNEKVKIEGGKKTKRRTKRKNKILSRRRRRRRIKY